MGHILTIMKGGKLASKVAVQVVESTKEVIKEKKATDEISSMPVSWNNLFDNDKYMLF